MALLSVAEYKTFFPDSTLTDSQIAQAIESAQLLAESPLGADRSLEVDDYTNVLSIPAMVGRVYLPYFPIVPDSLTVQIRGAELSLYGGLGVTSNDWQTIASDAYRIDYETNELWFISIANAGLYGNYSTSYSSLAYRRNSPTIKARPLQARVSYQAGFSPADIGEVDKLKRALALLTSIRYGGTGSVTEGMTGDQALANGIKSVELTGFYSVEYDQHVGVTSSVPTGAGNMASLSKSDELLYYFRKFRARRMASL